MSFWKDKTVLVAGGAGFIGSHLVTALLSQDAKVTVVDDFSTGGRDSISALENQRGGHLTVIESDITQEAKLPSADIIYNLACPASPVHYQADPIKTWKTSVIGTLRLLECRKSVETIFVQASTSEVYGDPLSHPQKETDWGNVNPIGVRACYDEGKRAAETLLMDNARVGGANMRIARIFNTYGPGMARADGRAIPNFIEQARNGQPLTICGDGSQTRSFCYVSDTVAALMRMAERPEARGEVINVGNPHEVMISEIADRINRILSNAAGTVFLAQRLDDPVRRCPDIGKARRLLGWQPSVSLDEGLRKVTEGVKQPTAVD